MNRLIFDDDGEATRSLDTVLRTLQRAVVEHPVAAQALFFALVAEGRAFARTAEGEAWHARLAGSELVVRARVLWDALTVRALEDDPDTVLPTAILEALVKAAAAPDMESALEDLFINGLAGL